MTNFSAADNFSKQAFASASTIYLILSASSKSLFNLLTFSLSALTFSLTTANSFFFYSTSAYAASLAFSKGSTNLNIVLNVTIFTAHAHNFDAA